MGGQDRELFQSSKSKICFFPGRCPGLEFANAFGVFVSPFPWGKLVRSPWGMRIYQDASQGIQAKCRGKPDKQHTGF
jgi:hypothetical protein